MGHLLAEEKGAIGERYILANHNVHFRDFYRTVAEVSGVPFPDRMLPRPVALGYVALVEGWAKLRKARPMATYKGVKFTAYPHYFDGTRARTELGLPSTPLIETMEKAIRWFRDNQMA